MDLIINVVDDASSLERSTYLTAMFEQASNPHNTGHTDGCGRGIN